MKQSFQKNIKYYSTVYAIATDTNGRNYENTKSKIQPYRILQIEICMAKFINFCHWSRDIHTTL